MTLEARQKSGAVSSVGPVSEGCSAHPSSLVPIQPGGSKPPFFCVPSSPDDGAAVLGLMARHLGPDQPLYGIQDGVQDPVMSVSCAIRMAPLIECRCGTSAARYVDEVRAVQPRGPYLLGGVSWGSPMAYEIAHQLQLQGQRVALLALVEPEPLWVPDLRVCFALAASFFRVVAHSLGRCPYEVGRPGSFRHAYPPGRAPSLRLKTEIAAKSWGPRRYARQPYLGPVHLFLVGDWPGESPSDSYARRCEWPDGGAEVHVILGIRDGTTDNGGDPIEGADAHILVQQLKGCIDDALANGYRF